MIFSHVLFIFIFLPVLLILYRVVPEPVKNPLLLIASLVFYAWGNQLFILVLLGSMVLNYVAAMFLEDQLVNEKGSLGLMLLGFTFVNVAILMAMKYVAKIECPMGVTFFTMMQISYLFEVANGDIRLEANVMNYALCVSFFPIILAGPVLEFSTIQEQLYSRKTLDLAALGDGLMWFTRGLLKVSVLATCAGTVYGGLTESRSVLGTWLMCAAFGYQIYFALCGYSDMARGIGKLLGFDIPKNFNYPILSRSFSDFMKRWYVSLTSFLYHYVSDLTAKKNRGFSMIRGTLLVALIMGVFYSNSTGTIIWGLYVGILIILERMFFGRTLRRIPVLGHIYYLILSVIGWGLFTGATASESFATIGRMFGIGASSFADQTFVYYLLTNFVLWIVLLLASLPYVHRVWDKVFTGHSGALNLVNAAVYLVAFMISVAFIVTGTGTILIPAGVFVI